MRPTRPKCNSRVLSPRIPSARKSRWQARSTTRRRNPGLGTTLIWSMNTSQMLSAKSMRGPRGSRKAETSGYPDHTLRRSRSAMPAAVNGNELHFNLRVVAPEYLLDVKSVGHLGLARFGRADDVVEVRKILT